MTLAVRVRKQPYSEGRYTCNFRQSTKITSREVHLERPLEETCEQERTESVEHTGRQ